MSSSRAGLVTIQPDLKEVLYAHARATPPVFVGLPGKGYLTYAENLHLARHVYHQMHDAAYTQASAFGLKSYTATFADLDETTEQTPRETFLAKLQRRVVAGQDGHVMGTDRQKATFFAAAVKQSAYETFMLHTHEAGDLCPEREQTVHDSVQRAGFADFRTMRKLLTQTPVRDISFIQGAVDGAWVLTAPTEAARQKHLARCNTDSITAFFANKALYRKPLPPHSDQEKNQLRQMHRWFGETKDLDGTCMAIKAAPGQTYPF